MLDHFLSLCWIVYHRPGSSRLNKKRAKDSITDISEIEMMLRRKLSNLRRLTKTLKYELCTVRINNVDRIELYRPDMSQPELEAAFVAIDDEEEESEPEIIINVDSEEELMQDSISLSSREDEEKAFRHVLENGHQAPHLNPHQDQETNYSNPEPKSPNKLPPKIPQQDQHNSHMNALQHPTPDLHRKKQQSSNPPKELKISQSLCNKPGGSSTTKTQEHLVQTKSPHQQHDNTPHDQLNSPHQQHQRSSCRDQTEFHTIPNQHDQDQLHNTDRQPLQLPSQPNKSPRAPQPPQTWNGRFPQKYDESNENERREFFPRHERRFSNNYINYRDDYYDQNYFPPLRRELSRGRAYSPPRDQQYSPNQRRETNYPLCDRSNEQRVQIPRNFCPPSHQMSYQIEGQYPSTGFPKEQQPLENFE